MAPSTELARIEPGGYLALREDPAEIEAIISENLGGQEIGEFDLPRIKVPSGGGRSFEIPTLGGIEPASTIEGIVVYFKYTRGYWAPDQANGTPPACRSDNGIVGVGDPGGHCKTCPLAQFGSAVDEKTGAQRDGQACSAKELWFMLRPGSYLPVVVALPATSLKNAKKYRVGTLGSSGMRLPSVVTRISLDPARNADGDYAIAVPSVAGILEPEEMARATQYAERLRPIFDATAAAEYEQPAAAGDGAPPTQAPPTAAAAGEPGDEAPEAKAA